MSNMHLTSKLSNIAAKEKIQKLFFLPGACGIVHAAYISAIILLVIAIVFLLVLLWRMRRRPCPRCGDLIVMVSDAIYLSKDFCIVPKLLLLFIVYKSTDNGSFCFCIKCSLKSSILYASEQFRSVLPA